MSYLVANPEDRFSRDVANIFQWQDLFQKYLPLCFQISYEQFVSSNVNFNISSA